MKRTLRWILGILLSPVLLFLTVVILLYMPPVQNYVVRKVAAYLSETTGSEVRVGHVTLKFPLDLAVNDILFIQPNDSLPQRKDTIAMVSGILADVKLMPLLENKVVVDRFEMSDAHINTASMIEAARVKGSIGRLYASSPGIDLNDETVRLTLAELSDADIDVALSDSVDEDTTQSSTKWRIFINKVKIANTGVAIHTPGDTTRVYAYMGKAAVDQTMVDLARQHYAVDRLKWTDGKVSYDNNYQPRLEGLDYNHLSLTDIRLCVDSIQYTSSDIRLHIAESSMKEQSGLQLTKLDGRVAMDSTRLSLPKMTLETPDSNVDLECDMDLNAFDEKNPGNVYLRLFAQLGKQDIMRFAGGMPQDYVRRYPNQPLTVRMSLNGNMQHVRISGIEVKLPTLFSFFGEGYAVNPTDIERMKAEVKMRASAFGVNLSGYAKADRQVYSAKLLATQGRGKVRLDGMYNYRSSAYRAEADISDVNVHRYLPKDSIYSITGKVKVSGRGFDPLSPRTSLTADAHVTHLGYGHFNLTNIDIAATLADGTGHIQLNSDNELLDGTITLDALMSRKKVDATIGADIRWADLMAMRLMGQPFATSVCAHVDVASDLKQSHSIQAFVNDFTIRSAKQTYRPKDLNLNIATSPDTTWAIVNSGNLKLDLHAKGGYEMLIEQMERLMAKVEQQRKDKVIDESELRALLPTLDIHLVSGNDNPIANMLRYKGFDFRDLSIDFRSSPVEGMGGRGHIYKMLVDSIPIDTMRFAIRQDTSRMNFSMMVQNNKFNPKIVFKSFVNGYIDGDKIGLDAQYFDRQDRKGLDVGVMAAMCDSGINVHLTPYRPLLGYKSFRLNTDNYVFFGRDSKVRAKVDLVADDGTGVKVYSDEDNPDMLQDLTVSINRLNLEQLTSVVPFMPQVGGMLNGDFHVMQDAERQLSVVSDMNVHNMSYEACRMGNIGSEFVYLQDGEDHHRVEARISRDNAEIGVLSGMYDNSNDGYLDATLDLIRTPLSLANGFIPDQIIGFDGYAEGTLSVKGPLGTPQVDGELYMDSCYVKSVPYGILMRCDDDPVRIVGSNLLFENFTLYGDNDSPLTIYGNVDFSNLDRMSMKMQMKADDYQVISAKKSAQSLAYGKAFVNFRGLVNGTMDALSVRGTLDVLGSTDLTYVLRDSPLNTNDRLSEIVTFTDFSDTTRVVNTARPSVGGLEMLLMMNVEQGARVKCILNPDQSNYVNVEGGGELRMTYSDMDGMQLYGRYTINDGEMKYQLPVIPLKTFTIGQGSYVEFNGDVMNPRLNLTATEQVKALVTAEGGNSRSVLFDCGVKVTKTLSDMGLEFTLDAPDDMSVKNELSAMSVEERGKLAVTMLTTGMYLNGESASNMTMNSALNAFLQGEINNITQSAMSTFDLSLGMEQNADASGETYTDYSFKFSKHFWGNRVNFVIGGTMSTGKSTTDDNDFIDNVSLEYRLDQSAMRYVRMFYNKDARDMFDQGVSEYGAGYVWRKKMNSLKELLWFMPAAKDTIKPVKKDEK